jgi:short-subunit dehydrogenase
LKLQDKWIVITGGSSGIGAEIAGALSKRGNHVTLVADGIAQLEHTLQHLKGSGANVDAERCDLGNHAETDDLVVRLLQRGVPDVLINNAGFGTYTTFEAASPAEIDRLLEVNLIGHVRLTKGLLGGFVARRSGAISFMASAAGRLPITPNATYCAAKHGMMGLAAALRHELRRYHIGVTAICPGRVDTPFFDHETFRRRSLGPENRRSISAGRVAALTIDAIERNRPVTFIPKTLGVASWLFDTLPFVSHPLYDRIMRARIERVYSDASR